MDPGWAGELAPDELEFLQVELSRDKKMAFKWGFRPGAKRRPEWAIRQVAMWGEPDRRSITIALARRPKAPASNSKVRFTPKNYRQEVKSWESPPRKSWSKEMRLPQVADDGWVPQFDG